MTTASTPYSEARAPGSGVRNALIAALVALAVIAAAITATWVGEETHTVAPAVYVTENDVERLTARAELFQAQAAAKAGNVQVAPSPLTQPGPLDPWGLQGPGID